MRGRIDILGTLSESLLTKGLVACRFEEPTFDTPRNRLVRAALDVLANRVDDGVLAHECGRLAGDLGRVGVGGLRPSRSELSADRPDRNVSHRLHHPAQFREALILLDIRGLRDNRPQAPEDFSAGQSKVNSDKAEGMPLDLHAFI